MKQLILLVWLFSVSMHGWAQTDTFPPPFKRFPTIPPMKLLLTDSSTWFTQKDVSKKLPVLIIIFNPQCEHCRLETEALVKNIDQFKGIQIIMATMMSFDSMKVFYNHYGLKRFGNIVVGQDKDFMLPTFYNIRNLPFLAFYNRKKEFIAVAEGGLGIPQILAMFNE